MQPGDVPKTHADITQLMKDYDFKPTVKINTGIKNFVNWFKSYKNII